MGLPRHFSLDHPVGNGPGIYSLGRAPPEEEGTLLGSREDKVGYI